MCIYKYNFIRYVKLVCNVLLKIKIVRTIYVEHKAEDIEREILIVNVQSQNVP